MQMFHRTSSEGEIRLAVRVSGASSRRSGGNPVVLVHGMGGDHTTWRGFAAALRSARRTVVSLDLRGHGRSGHAAEYGLASFADDLAFVLDRLDVARADVVGHSLGAHTALRMAMAHPERVRSLVLEEVPPMPRDQAHLDENITPQSSVGERLRGVGQLIANPVPLLRFDRRVGGAVGAQFQRADPVWWERLSAVTAPTLVISGGPSSFLPSHHLAALSDSLPHSRWQIIPAGHSVHRSKPKEFLSLAGGFIAGQGDRG